MIPKVLRNTEGFDTVLAENLGHLPVGGEEGPVAGVLQVVLLEVGPQEFDTLRTAGLRQANYSFKINADLIRLSKGPPCERRLDDFFSRSC